MVFSRNPFEWIDEQLGGMRPFSARTPLFELRRTLIDEVDSALRGAIEGAFGRRVPINVWSGPDRVLLEAEVPGCRQEDVDVEVHGTTLTLKVRPHESAQGGELRLAERGRGEAVREVELPFRVDLERVEATLRQGVLQVVLPRAAQDSPRMIKIS